MAKILLYTIHDYACSGIRLLGAYSRSKGHDTRLCFLGSEHGMFVPRELPIGFLKSLDRDDNEIPFNIRSSAPDINLPINNFDICIPEVFLSFLKNLKPGIVGFSCRSLLTPYFNGWFTQIHEILPNSLIIAGGYGPTLEPEAYLKKGADIVVRGEGETALVELAECIDNNRDWSSLNNLVYKRNGITYINPLGPAIRDLDSLPQQLMYDKGIYVIIDESLIEKDPILKDNIGMCFLSRGCIGSCTYCSSGHWRDIYNESGTIMPKYRYPSIDTYMETFKRLKGLGAKTISLQDDYFIRSYEEMIVFFERYEKEIGLPIFAYLHPIFLKNHPDILPLAIQSGLISVTLPVQSADNSFNKNILNRSTDFDIVLKCAAYAQEHFVPFYTNFIDGFTTNYIDPDQYFNKNIEFIKNLPAFNPGFPRLVVYSIFYLRLHLNSPLLKSNITKRMNYSCFFYRAMLMLFRHIFNDDEYNAISKNTFYKSNPELLIDLYAKIRELKRKLYMYNTVNKLNGHDVYLWASKSMYIKRKHYLLSLRPKVVIVDDRLRLRNIDGFNTIQESEFLTNNYETLPIIICTENAQNKARKLKKYIPDYPYENIYGFGYY